MYSKTQKLCAEAFGTFVLVFFGCGTAMVTGANVVATSLAFGLSILVAAYTIGGISGAHLNPAVSFAMFFDGRMTLAEAISYSIAQTVGAFCASLMHLILALCGLITTVEYDDGDAEYVKASLDEISFGANAFGETGNSALNIVGAILVEVILTCIFVLVILAVTQSEDEGTKKHAGLFIGAALVFVHLMGIPLTGTSVNPARSIAPALFATICKGDINYLLEGLVFIVAPLAGAFCAAFINTALIKKKG
ncbi:aquaporin Z [Ruminococcus sp. YE71]|uniref:MIP/aquaporin family protein n=1 Tax=unclassified Ruminococcus TaxID=2608920 RepID=UPI00088E6445|nr:MULTISPECIES: MIP/aquaporin family protein [unclassified Ruminococcus]SDA16820.1 aquaporin Z [Ruminococcus sp. YE78]SFW25670.1 aquaporin Z [Ruminococcus sp. YE71]